MKLSTLTSLKNAIVSLVILGIGVALGMSQVETPEPEKVEVVRTDEVEVASENCLDLVDHIRKSYYPAAVKLMAKTQEMGKYVIENTLVDGWSTSEMQEYTTLLDERTNLIDSLTSETRGLNGLLDSCERDG